ncbi:MAG: carboxypeptidase-like regulatory domain-containing protein [Flavobacteriales bacterium]|nr:carboxypeptidase-like regulatory domain-containing protein [Flavobacteriales bacterium]
MRGRAIHTTMRLIALLSGLVVLQAAIAQTTRISGTVTDANTGEPLPFVNISFIDSRVATNSDFDGHYALETYYATDSIKAGSVGYVPFTAKVKRDVAQTIDIKMRPSTAELKSVTVTYAGNPAFPILRRLIANKPVNNREKLGAYQYDAYNKVEFDINNITEGFEKKKLFKDFAFIFDHVDTTGGKRFLPIFMTETLSEVYYRQQPKVRRELIHGSKTSGVENESISMFMGDMYQNVNIYDNYLVIFDKNFISPIADGGKGFYHYHLLDSNWVGNNWCYKIAFTPKRVQEPAFTGEMWVNDTSYAVRNIEASIAPGANLNFVQSFSVKQEYSEVKPEVWMLTHDQLVVDLNIIRDRGKPNKHAVQGFYGRRTASYRDFVINKPRPDEFYKGADEVVMDIDPLSQGAAYWDENRHENLTAQELAIYHMVDTMKTILRFRRGGPL